MTDSWTARQLDSYSTARQLDRTRQSSTELDRARQTSTPRHMQSVSTGSTATRQLLDSYSTATRQVLDRLDRQGLDSGSTEARRSLDSSTARQPGLKDNPLRPARDVRRPAPRPAASAAASHTHTSRPRIARSACRPRFLSRPHAVACMMIDVGAVPGPGPCLAPQPLAMKDKK